MRMYVRVDSRKGSYPPTGLTKCSHWMQIEPELVPIARLTFRQEQLSIQGLLGIAAGGPTFTPDPYPNVVEYEGSMFLEDGHHRVCIAAVRGEELILARVFRYES